MVYSDGCRRIVVFMEKKKVQLHLILLLLPLVIVYVLPDVHILLLISFDDTPTPPG